MEMHFATFGKNNREIMQEIICIHVYVHKWNMYVKAKME